MAGEIVGESIMSKIAELLVEPTIRQFSYMFCFNNFVPEFKGPKENLTLALDRLQKAARRAERNDEEIEKDVNKWLEDAKKEIEDANHLDEQIEKNGKCFTWCPNWMPRCKLSKASAKKIKTLRELEEKSRKFQTLSHKAPLQDKEFLPDENFTPSESSKEAFEQIMEALRDDKVNMIGLYGMGGVGKTTMVKEVMRRAKELKLFDEVLMVVVSQNPDVIKIQNEMADSLGLKFEESSVKGKTNRLRQRLVKEKTVLIILDDVWNVIHLEEIGIPFGNDHRGCKILLTTRLKNICFSMRSQRKVFLGVLSENEAWALFKRKADLRDEDSAMNKVAKEVAGECKGLPIALVTVGSALRDKSKDEWEAASKKLKNSRILPIEQIDEQKNAYTTLKLSYDYLKHEKAKLCFLLCCLFPEDSDIPIEDLTRYAFGYGLHRDEESIEDARKQVYLAVKHLKDCCLLLGTENEECVKMHDLVRDVAIQIASSSKEFGFVVKAGIGLKRWPGSPESFEGCTAISLMGNRLTELREGLVCLQLKVLLLELDYSVAVPPKFFEGMKAIEEPSISAIYLLECKNLISLRKLQRLKILCFREYSLIEPLPEEIGELENLRLLDLTGCKIPVNLIGRLKHLEELLIGSDSFGEWGVGGRSRGGMNASLTELNSLSHLSVLSLRIPEINIPRDFVFPKLLKYEIVLGIKRFPGFSRARRPFPMSQASYPTSRRLTFSCINTTFLNAKTFDELFRTVSQLDLYHVSGLKNLTWSSNHMIMHEQQQGLYLNRDHALENLQSVRIRSCVQLEEVFELGEEKTLLLSSLTKLELECLPNLKNIWKRPNRHVSLQSLTYLKLRNLPKLAYVFPVSVAPSLLKLEEIDIADANELKQIFGSGEGEDVLTIDGNGDRDRDGIIEFPQLRKLELHRSGSNLKFFGSNNFAVKLPSLQHLQIEGHNQLGNLLAKLLGLMLKNLTTLEVIKCKGLRHILPSSMIASLLQLKVLKISRCEELKEIIAMDNEGGMGQNSLGNEHLKRLCFPNPLELSLQGLPSLVYFCTATYDFIFPSLEMLKVEKCPKMNPMLTVAVNDSTSAKPEVESFVTSRKGGRELSLPSLETLKLSSLPYLRSICKGLMLKNLTTLEVINCEGLRYLLSSSMIASLRQLRALKISGCEELEEIIAKDKIWPESHLQSLCFPRLCEIEISRCNKLKSLFPVITAARLSELQCLKVREARQLTEVFGQYDNSSPVNVEKEIVVPNLLQLSLKNLPSIVCFGLGCKKFLFPRLEKCVVGSCPKMATKFIVSQVAEDSSSTYKMWTRDGGWKEQDSDLGSFWWIRGLLEKSSVAQDFPNGKVVYSFLQDIVPSSFPYPGWNEGRITCQRSQLKRILSTTESISDGTKKDKFIMPVVPLPLPTGRWLFVAAHRPLGSGYPWLVDRGRPLPTRRVVICRRG
ncbi:unnamed protein product [Dovyalis caffra]|uniref:AAA+ ATPase domain-containing protein n=1 Tax=Dovyalis caffra TaxID=77055 RepID=A0AAV1QTD9_9ROSI|nr:unnamed protein product [Dovyalis caffra]